VRDPAILILDEATSHLDAVSEQLVQSALHNAARGRTTIVIAHRLSTIRDADRIIVLERGRVVEQGTWESLLDAGGVFERLTRGFVA
jgi:ATP-binding cassette subfamily B protein